MPEREPQTPPVTSETLLSMSGSTAGFAADGELPAGTKVGKYELRKLLGRGGMGAVYEALDTVLRREVALKILPRALTQDEQALKRFIREAQLAAQLNHPNVVTVYDVGRKGETYFIAMELVRGPSADDLLRKRGAMSVKAATQLTLGACRAVHAAHQAGLIHRDVKPANILCAVGGQVKLTDFGLAKLHVADVVTLTQKDVVLGTPKFMSPEQCNNEAVDARSDLYSLGATYYALLTGAAPFDQGTTMQILFAHCSKPVPDPRELSPQTPEACAAIIRRAMAKSPAERYATAADMQRDLEQVVRGGTVAVAATASATAAAGASPALTELLGALDDRSRQASAAGAQPQLVLGASRAKGRSWPMLTAAAIVVVAVAGTGVLWLATRHGTPAVTAPPVTAESVPAVAPPPGAVAVTAAPEAAPVMPDVVKVSEPQPAAAPPPVEAAPAEAPPVKPVPTAPPFAMLPDVVEPAPAPPEEPQDTASPDDPDVTLARLRTRFEQSRESLAKAYAQRDHTTMRTTLRRLEEMHHLLMRSDKSDVRALAMEIREVLERYKPQGGGGPPQPPGEEGDRPGPPQRDGERRPRSIR